MLLEFYDNLLHTVRPDIATTVTQKGWAGCPINVEYVLFCFVFGKVVIMSSSSVDDNLHFPIHVSSYKFHLFLLCWPRDCASYCFGFRVISRGLSVPVEAHKNLNSNKAGSIRKREALYAESWKHPQIFVFKSDVVYVAERESQGYRIIDWALSYCGVEGVFPRGKIGWETSTKYWNAE